jgi:hypothetical protein
MTSIKITLPKGFKATEIINEGMEDGRDYVEIGLIDEKDMCKNHLVHDADSCGKCSGVTLTLAPTKNQHEEFIKNVRVTYQKSSELQKMVKLQQVSKEIQEQKPQDRNKQFQQHRI